MSFDGERALPLEIGHVLFIDIVGYSKLLINEQSELLEHLKEMVRGSEQVRSAEALGNMIRLTTGDGVALVFFSDKSSAVPPFENLSDERQSMRQRVSCLAVCALFY